MIEDLKDVLELAVNASSLIKEIVKTTKDKNKKQDKDYAKIGSSGYPAQIGSSEHSAKIGSSGDFAKIDSTGKESIISAIGYNSISKGKKGSWITLAEYRKKQRWNFKNISRKSRKNRWEKY